MAESDAHRITHERHLPPAPILNCCRAIGLDRTNGARDGFPLLSLAPLSLLLFLSFPFILAGSGIEPPPLCSVPLRFSRASQDTVSFPEEVMTISDDERDLGEETSERNSFDKSLRQIQD